jgi:hypothetical protein
VPPLVHPRAVKIDIFAGLTISRGKNDMFKFQVTLDRQSAKYCLLPNTPHFSLLSTFKGSRPDRRKKFIWVFDGQQDERHVTETGMQASF